MKKYLLFDLDGTLTDPKEGICTCVQYALSSFGIEEPDLDKLESFIGPPLKDSFMKFYDFTEEQAEAAVVKYRERFQDKGLYENEIYPGISEMLQRFMSKGMFLAVASSKPTVYVEKILEHFNIKRFFKVVVGSELNGTRVNKDEVVEEALKQLFGDQPVDRTQVYMIGDRSYDIEGARKAGVESVGVAYGYGGMEELKAAKADYIVRSVEELEKFLLRGAEEQQVLTPFQKIWQLFFPLLLFVMVKALAVNMMGILLQTIG
ncbi:MAG: HAD family hydrolase, partial [Acetatifactor sp.]|nr:HAD family hydrolase [Acetatifactor sp.]